MARLLIVLLMLSVNTVFVLGYHSLQNLLCSVHHVFPTEITHALFTKPRVFVGELLCLPLVTLRLLDNRIPTLTYIFLIITKFRFIPFNGL